MDGSAGEVEGDSLDAALALLATPDATGPIGRDEIGGHAVAPAVADRTSPDAIRIDGDRAVVGAMVPVRHVLDLLPPPTAEFVIEAVGEGYLDAVTVGEAVARHDRAPALALALLAFEGVVTLTSRGAPYDLPLAALVVAPPPPSDDTLTVALRLTLGGEIGVAVDDTDGSPVAAVARRTPAGRVLVAMSGVAPGPVLVRDPAEQRRPGGTDPMLDRVVAVHRRAIDAIGSGTIHRSASEPSASGSAEAVPVVGRAVDRPALLERRPGEVASSSPAEVVVDHHHEVPAWRVIGRPRVVPPPWSPASPSDALYAAVIEVSGPEEVEPLRRIDGVVGATLVEDTDGRTVAVGLLADSEPAVRRAMEAAGVHRDPGSADGTTVVETVILLDPTDVDDASLFETYLRLDAGTDGRAPGRVTGTLDEDGRIVVTGRLADPFALRRSVAHHLGAPAGTLRLASRPMPGTPVPDALVALVAGTVRESRRPVVGLGSGSRRPARALTASSTLDPDGVVDSLQVQNIASNRSGGSAEIAVAWAAELHLAALARSLGIPRDELVVGAPTDRAITDAAERVKELVGFERRRDLRWSTPAERPGVSRGIGLAVAPPVPEHRAAASATVTWAGGASFVVAVTAGDTVSGLHLALAQIAAEILGSTVADIAVIGGDTDRVPPGEGIVDAGFAVVAGAVKQASDDLRRRFARRAARRLGVEATRIELRDGAAHGPDGTAVTLDDLGGRPSGADVEPLVGSGWGGGSGHQAGGATAVALEVELSTGMVTVLEIVTATCAGVVVNPLGAGVHQRHEMIDAAAEALGRRLDESPLLTNVFLEEPDDAAPCGARSLGGVVRRSVLPALHAAVFDATGVELDVVPFTAARLRAALRADR